LGNILCIDSYIPCPYNDLKVGTQPDQGSDNIKVGDVYSNFSNTTTNGRTPIQFKISDKQPCTLPYYENTNENLYKLDAIFGRHKCYRGIANSIEDNNYKKIDQYNKKKLMEDNYITQIVSTLPVFNINTYDVPTNLYFKGYIGVNPSCHKILKKSKESFLNILNTIQSDMDSTIILSLVIMIFSIFGFVGMIVFIIAVYNDGNAKNMYISTICVIIFSLVSFIMMLCLNFNLDKYSSNNSVMSDSKCVDIVASSAFNNFYSKIGISQTMCNFVSGLSAILIAFMILSVKIKLSNR
jgi:hypothetical protein